MNQPQKPLVPHSSQLHRDGWDVSIQISPLSACHPLGICFSADAVTSATTEVLAS